MERLDTMTADEYGADDCGAVPWVRMGVHMSISAKPKQIRVYIASGLENMAAVQTVRDILTAQGIGITYDWTAHGPAWREGHARMAEVAQSEINGVTSADGVIAILPGGRGTHTEIGAALASKIPVFLFTPDEGIMAGAQTCAFYHHPGVEVIPYTGAAPSEVLLRLAVGRIKPRGPTFRGAAPGDRAYDHFEGNRG